MSAARRGLRGRYGGAARARRVIAHLALSYMQGAQPCLD